MKKINVVNIVAAMVIFVLGIYLGFNRGTKLGYEKGTEYLSMIASIQDAGIAVELNNDVKLLRYLQNNEINESKEMLESLVDVHVMSLGNTLKPMWSLPPMDPYKKRIHDAIENAKQYREKYPEHEPKLPKIKREIEEAFRNISGR
ncbi:MAG: hypothetical protein ABSG42_00360 [Nitrospirota bacterium]